MYWKVCFSLVKYENANFCQLGVWCEEFVLILYLVHGPCNLLYIS